MAQNVIRGMPTPAARGPSLVVGAYAPNFVGPLPNGYVGAGASFVPNYYAPPRLPTVINPPSPVPPPITFFTNQDFTPPSSATVASSLPPLPYGALDRTRVLSPPEPVVPAPPAANGLAHFTVKLPADAKLWVNDAETKPIGSSRRFHTPPNLEPGKNYEYTFRAQWTDNAQTVTHDRNVRFKAGDDLTVDFSQSPSR
jgi:uncharacterized protein (TIGR03000 family)